MDNINANKDKADYLLRSSAVFTSTGDKPVPGSVAVSGNRIMEVVFNGDDAHLIGENTIVKDFGDRMIMPGFIDAHTHFVDGALTESSYVCDLTESVSEEDAVRMLKEYREEHNNDRRMRGFGWFPANWDDGPLPTKISLDKAFPDIPVYCLSADGHTLWMNSAGLEEAGYDEDYIPEAGEIGRFEDGKLNGLALEPAAYKAGIDKFKELTPEQAEGIIKDFVEKASSVGVTSISDMLGEDYLKDSQAYLLAAKSLLEKGELTCRIHIYIANLWDMRMSARWKNLRRNTEAVCSNTAE